MPLSSEGLSVELQAVIAEFLRHNEIEKCVSRLTLTAYASDLRCLEKAWRQLLLPDTIEAASVRSLRQCLHIMHGTRRYKASTINRRCDTLRSFFRFAVEQGYLSTNPMDK